MKSILATAVALWVASSAAGAQRLAGHFSPNPALPGEPVTLTLTDATGGGFHWGCDLEMIRVGEQDGPVVTVASGCNGALFFTPPDGSRVVGWDQNDVDGNPAAPGRYWFRARSFAPGDFALSVDWFCLSIQDANAPALRLVDDTRVGEATELQLTAPNEPFAPFLVLASITSNHPLSLPGLDLCLTPDLLFAVTLAAAVSPVFEPGLGWLDGAGAAVVRAAIPDDPSLSFQGFHVQALLATAAGIVATNDLSLTILP